MNGLGIILLKLNQPDALFHGLMEFWPWDVIWDGHAAAFRRVDRRLDLGRARTVALIE